MNLFLQIDPSEIPEASYPCVSINGHASFAIGDCVYRGDVPEYEHSRRSVAGVIVVKDGEAAFVPEVFEANRRDLEEPSRDAGL